MMRARFMILAAATCACGGSTPPPASQPATATATATAAPAETTMAQLGIRVDWMDTTADPCTDFYRYSCGRFLDETKIPDDQRAWGTMTALRQSNEEVLRDILDKAVADPGEDPARKKLGTFYHACMDETRVNAAGLDPLRPLLDEVAKVTDARSLDAELVALHRRGIFPVFDLTDRKDISGNDLDVAFLDQSGLGLPDRDYYFGDAPTVRAMRDAYRRHVARMFELVGEKPAEAAGAADDVVRVETALAEMQQTRVERRDPHARYHRVDRAGLAKLAPHFPWDAYFAVLGTPSLQAVAVSSPAYFTGWDALLAREKPTAMRHYLAWTVMRATADQLSQPFVEESFEFGKRVSGAKKLPERWKRCVRETDANLGELLGAEYVRLKFGPEAKADVVRTLHGIRDAMAAELRSLPWMDDMTRVEAVKKLERMTELVGYPERVKSYDFDVGPDLLANVLGARSWALSYRVAKMGKPMKRDEFGMSAPTVNAYYTSELDQMVFPAGILQPPIYSRDFVGGLKSFSAMGAAMGHELTHGFDDSGSQFDADGNLRNWWSDATGQRFHDSSKCVIDTYSSYEVLPGLTVNGKLTAGEDIADVGGLKLAYHAYHATPEGKRGVTAGGLSQDQLFFVGYGQLWCQKDRSEALDVQVRTNPHAPNEVRVRAGVSQVAEFGEAFACPVGAPERPKQSCSVW